ncbi:hypothetical protein [Microbacterium saperdae]|uniref:Uncharacterized protein n=1 Tax=Microbacterium saperdae TaxID=69368 RepID=A0A543BAN9_9MICO|nr:hypothetical protein [Microbacterium saperdae]TQL81897.1 hypothetical protein FB560_3378 [Microbacterium saperdae]GGM35597.1 hypothetical protein GCM10010489_03120 [Microbacterium saperdae]
MEYLTIEIPVHLWWRVDGCVDNSMAIDAVEAVIETTMVGSCVRDAGWRASAAFDGERDQYGWPPQRHPLPIVLRTAHWEWTLEQLDRWEPYATDSTSAEVRGLIAAALRDR